MISFSIARHDRGGPHAFPGDGLLNTSCMDCSWEPESSGDDLIGRYSILVLVQFKRCNRACNP
jgi:hypothetical protein